MASVARETWTDERLDDLKDGMHREFGNVHREFGEVRTEIRELRTETNARFDSMHRTMIGGFVSVVAAIIVAGIF